MNVDGYYCENNSVDLTFLVVLPFIPVKSGTFDDLNSSRQKYSTGARYGPQTMNNTLKDRQRIQDNVNRGTL